MLKKTCLSSSCYNSSISAFVNLHIFQDLVEVHKMDEHYQRCSFICGNLLLFKEGQLAS